EAAAEQAFAEADTVVTRDIIYPRCHPAPLETCGMIADFDPETGQLDIYNGNQAPHAHRTVYAHVAGLAEHMIRIRCNDIGCGSYDLAASHVKVKAVYTNKAPGGVAYRCSFRITEAVYLVERMVDALALEMSVDPIELRMRSFIAPEQFPYETTTGWTYDSGNYAETM